MASTRGDQSRAVALHLKALKYAELAHDLRAVGLAHFELARCYKLVGDRATVADHFSEAATALHAVGDKRNLALVHSLSGSGLAQQGRYDEALDGPPPGRTPRSIACRPTTWWRSRAATRPTSR